MGREGKACGRSWVRVGNGVRVDLVVLIASLRGRLLLAWGAGIKGKANEKLTLFMYKAPIYIQYRDI